MEKNKKKEVLKKFNAEEVNTVAKKINSNLSNVLERTDVLIEELKNKQDYDKYYSDIEDAIISWSNDGTKTAGTLTRKIIKILKK